MKLMALLAGVVIPRDLPAPSPVAAPAALGGVDMLLRLAKGALPFIPSVVTIALVIVGLVFASRLLERSARHHENRQFRNQMIMLGLSILGLLIVVTALPIAEGTKGQLLSLLGIVLSAAIALSSTTILGNAIAGVMLRAVRNFRMGDFIRVADHFGRVSERGLFHTEIQTEDRELTTLPNLFLVTHPVTTLRTSGTIVSATVSLGYDVPRKKIEKLLLEAADDCDLSEPFVQIRDLGDFSVTYRVAGLLTDVKRLISVSSRLRCKMMDRLHGARIEIVSPTFMNQRPQPDGRVFIPHVERLRDDAEDAQTGPEDVVFDKADEAEALESLVGKRDAVAAEVAVMKTDLASVTVPEQQEELAQEVERLERRVKRLDIAIEARSKRVQGEA